MAVLSRNLLQNRLFLHPVTIETAKAPKNRKRQPFGCLLKKGEIYEKTLAFSEGSFPSPVTLYTLQM